MTAREVHALLTWPCPADILAPLTDMGVIVEPLARGADNEAGMCAAIAGKDALLCHPWVPVTAAVIAAGDRLRVVSTYAVGYDNIDVAACKAHRVLLGHTPGVVVEPTADVTYALILSVMREIISGDRYVRAGKWLGGIAPHGVDLWGRTLGIIGMGAIGSAVARRAMASGMKIAYSNRKPKADAPPGATFLTLDDLLANADCVVVLAPLNAQTRGMIGAKEFAKMKPGAFFVNAARGALVDTQALYDTLSSKHLRGAAVDVLEPEPIGADHPLLALPNFFITPHIGTATDDTRRAMATLMVANAVAGLRGDPLPAAVPGSA
jgi:glyoxylate reductase